MQEELQREVAHQFKLLADDTWHTVEAARTIEEVEKEVSLCGSKRMLTQQLSWVHPSWDETEGKCGRSCNAGSEDSTWSSCELRRRSASSSVVG